MIKYVCIYACTVYAYKNRNATLYRCTTLSFDNLKELIQFTLFTFGSCQNFNDFCFSTIIEKFKTPSDFSASLPVCRSQLKKTMILERNAWACISRIVVHFQTLFVIVCWNVSDPWRVRNVRNVCTMCPDTSKPGQLSQVTNQFISWYCNSATRHFYTDTVECFICKEKFETNLHQTHSSCKRLLIQRSSPDYLQQQLLTHSPWAFWCRAKRRCLASFGRTRGVAPQPLHENFRNQTATASALCSEIASAEISLEEMHRKNHEPSPHLYYWVSFFFITLSSLKQIQDKTALHLQCCQVCRHMAYVDIKSWRKRTCLAHPQVYSLPSCHSLPWQPPKHHTCRSFLNPFTKNQMHWMHWTRTYRMYKDVYTMYSSNAPLGGKGPSELILWNQ